jgi:hypothetical protein
VREDAITSSVTFALVPNDNPDDALPNRCLTTTSPASRAGSSTPSSSSPRMVRGTDNPASASLALSIHLSVAVRVASASGKGTTVPWAANSLAMCPEIRSAS